MSWDGRTKIPVVEVIAPDGRKSLWAAAVAMAKAVAAVKEVIPPNYVATLTKRRLTITRKSEVLRRGEVRRINTSPRGPQLAGAVSLRLPWCLWLLLSGLRVSSSKSAPESRIMSSPGGRMVWDRHMPEHPQG